MNISGKSIINGIIVLLASVAQADKPPISYKVLGRVRYDIGQLVNTTLPVTPGNDTNLASGAWMHTVSGELGGRAKLFENVEFYAGYRTRLYHRLQDGRQLLNNAEKSFAAGLTECKLDARLGRGETRQLQFTAGLFNYIYNHESQDLGNYLFSSGVYPGYVYSGLDSVQLLGVRLGIGPGRFLSHELLVTSEIAVEPLYDISLGYVGEARAGNVFSFGAGIAAHHLISVNRQYTTPSLLYTLYDTVTHDSVVFTHRGIKLMARFTFDPKPLFGAKRLGREDLKFYGEGVLLGVKDYPIYYTGITERIPVMMGFNLPAFGLLDIAALEAEWYGSPHSNNPESKGRPFPSPDDRDRGCSDDIKWAITAYKVVYKGFSLRVRVASDHLRLSGDSREWTVAPRQWYWMLRMAVDF